MKYKYTNEHIQKKLREYVIAFRITIGMILLGLFLITLSIFRTYLDIYVERKIDINNIKPDDKTIYTYEITEDPVEIYEGYYAVKTADDVILMKYIDDEIKELNKNGYVKVKGIIQENKSDSGLQAAALQYFIDNGYSGKDSVKYSEFYLSCTSIVFKDKLDKDHSVGKVFGYIVLVYAFIWELLSRSRNAIKNLRPACGSTGYSHQEIDDQANLPVSEWIADNEVYITPKIIIGTNRGLTAVEYTDIQKVYVKKTSHIRSKTSRKIYYTYEVIAKTANNKSLVLCDGEKLSPKLKAAIIEKCGSDIWKE